MSEGLGATNCNSDTCTCIKQLHRFEPQTWQKAPGVLHSSRSSCYFVLPTSKIHIKGKALDIILARGRCHDARFLVLSHTLLKKVSFTLQ